MSSPVTLTTFLVELAPPGAVDVVAEIHDNLHRIDNTVIDRAIVGDDWTDALERLVAARDLEIVMVRDLAIELYDDVAVSGRELPHRDLHGRVVQPDPADVARIRRAREELERLVLT